MSGFLLEQVQAACLAHLRERVADSVRTLWREKASAEREVSRDAGAGAGSGSGLGEGTGSRSVESIVANSVSEFSARLEAAREAVHMSTVIDAEAFLESFIETHLSDALPKLCALHPCHPRVTALAVWLIRKQAREQQGALMAFLSSYAMRKLGEVSSASGKQFKKAIDGGFGVKNDLALYPSPASPVPLRGTRSSRQSHRAHRKAKVLACILEIQKFFVLGVDCADVKACGNKITADAKAINVECFILKPINIRCSGISTKGLSGSGTGTGTGTGTGIGIGTGIGTGIGAGTVTGTGTLGLLDNGFQNGMACICEAIHDLVEAMAAAAGDVIPGEPTAGSPPGAAGSSLNCADSFDTQFPPSFGGDPDPGSVRDTVSLHLPLPQGPSWASMLSRKGSNGPTPLKQDQLVRSIEIPRSDLSRAETVTAVENTRRVIVAMMTWAAVQMEHGAGELAGGTEAAGKLSIQIVKFMTSCMPSLLYFDIFLGQCMSVSSGQSFLCCPFSPYKSQSSCNPGRKWNSFIAAEGCTSPSCGGMSDREGDGHHPYPSDVLSVAASLGLLTAESLTFVLTASSRQTTLNYFSACKDLPLLKENLASVIRAFIGRYYLVLYRSGQVRRAGSESDGGSERSAARNIGTEGDPQVVFNGLCHMESDSTWFREQSALNAMTKEINIDIMNIFVKLCK
jgi:hypothetical protein